MLTARSLDIARGLKILRISTIPSLIQPVANNIGFLNKRPMGHIAHLSNLGPCRKMICISFPFDPRGPMI
jgi:hypothetical protein